MSEEYDFSGNSDMDLVMMQHEARRFKEDKKFVEAVLKELSRRGKERRKP